MGVQGLRLDISQVFLGLLTYCVGFSLGCGLMRVQSRNPQLLNQGSAVLANMYIHIHIHIHILVQIRKYTNIDTYMYVERDPCLCVKTPEILQRNSKPETLQLKIAMTARFSSRDREQARMVMLLFCGQRRG